MNTNFETFQHELDSFSMEFSRKLAEAGDKGINLEDSWRSIRDVVLFDYPTLRTCYDAHGEERHRKLDDQSYSARLGRRFAAAMTKIRKDIAKQLRSESAYNRKLDVPDWGLEIIEKSDKLYVIIGIAEDDMHELQIKVGTIIAKNDEEALSLVPEEERESILQWYTFDIISMVKSSKVLENCYNVIKRTD